MPQGITVTPKLLEAAIRNSDIYDSLRKDAIPEVADDVMNRFGFDPIIPETNLRDSYLPVHPGFDIKDLFYVLEDFGLVEEKSVPHEGKPIRYWVLLTERIASAAKNKPLGEYLEP